MSEKITLYIVNKNYSRYLDKSIQSSLNQTYKNIDIIIVDDASTDNSSSILDKYKSLEQVRIVKNKNSLGLIKSSNIAIKAAKGNYVIRLDADDVIKNNCIELLYDEIKKNSQIALVYSNYYIIDENDKIIFRKKEINFNKNKYREPILAACCLIKKSVLYEVGLYDERYSRQDGYDLWYKLIGVYKIFYLNKYLFYYRQHKKNLTKNKHSLFKTRSKIIYNLSKKNLREKKILTVLFCRDKNIENINVLRKIKNKTYIQHAIDDCLRCKYVSKIIIVTESDKIINILKSKYKNKIFYYKRNVKDAQINKSLKPTVLKLGKKNCDILVLVQPQYFFSRSHYIEQAIGKLNLNKFDKVISCVSEDINFNFYKQSSSGIKIISNNNELRLKYEKDLIFKETGGITVYNFNKYKKNNIKKIGNIVVEAKEIKSIL